MIPFVQAIDRVLIRKFTPPAISSKLEALAEEAERNYRRVQQVEPGNQERLVKTVRQFAADVFKTRVAELLKSRSGGPEAFKRDIAPTGMESTAGFCYADKLYVGIEGHAMPPDLVKEIQSELSGRRREAQNLWYTPDLVPEDWEKFLGNGPSSAAGTPDSPSADHEAAPSPETHRKAPAEFFKEYRAKCPMASYEQIAASIGISRDCLFRIKGETAWVSSGSYEAAAKSLACQPEDLYPRNLERPQRRGRTRHK